VIAFVRAGSFDVVLGGARRRLSEGSVFIQRPGLEFRCGHTDLCPTDVCISVAFDPDAVSGAEHAWERAGWSVRARIVFWALLGIELLIIGFVGSWWRWPWLLLLSMPLMIWFLARQKRNLRAVMVAFLDELAKERSLIPVRPQDEVGRKIRLAGQLK